MLKDEARTMTKFRSPYIVQILGVVMHPSNYALVLEYMCHGSLREYQKNNDVSWPTILGLVHDVILGMNYLHKTVGLVHRDVKIDNILVDKGPKAKISDFGLSVWHEYSKMVPRRSRVSTTSGDQGAYCTVTHIAPECLEDINRKPDNKRDVYSFGITLWEIVTKKYPYGWFCRENICNNWGSEAWDAFQGRVQIAETDCVARVCSSRASSKISVSEWCLSMSGKSSHSSTGALCSVATSERRDSGGLTISRPPADQRASSQSASAGDGLSDHTGNSEAVPVEVFTPTGPVAGPSVDLSLHGAGFALLSLPGSRWRDPKQ
uniref:Receptor-interacting serine/threonine-protein kinase 1-like n=1 Tax=Saccoglossus kowalevskii TaxID=10224 RepID=A0ABM0M4Y0_SACKO|nr:PREDICTED: receptor-interacting serine/threonine-protein kinase 1-like [Saccoglossus kowalevskii]